MQRHTHLMNAIPVDGPLAGAAGPSLNPQQCFEKAMETVAAGEQEILHFGIAAPPGGMLPDRG
jgi:hypothetical protein